MLAVLTTLFSGLMVIAYWLGLLDRPKFAKRRYIVDTKEELFAIIATSTSEPTSKGICNLFTAAKKEIDKQNKSESLLSNAASTYGAPEGSSSVAVILYFEAVESGSQKVNQDRWACGFLVDSKNFEEAKNIVGSLSSTPNVDYSIRAMRLGPGPVLRGRIPWRNKSCTPIIAKYLHWNRAFDSYNSEGDVIACEVYVTGLNQSPEYIDYILIDAKSTSMSGVDSPSPQ
jgi:hypothetical protein